LSGIITYSPLSKAVVKQLVQRQVGKLQERLASSGSELQVQPSVITWLADQYDSKSGARSIDKLIHQHLEDALLMQLAEAGYPDTISRTARVQRGALLLS